LHAFFGIDSRTDGRTPQVWDKHDVDQSGTMSLEEINAVIKVLRWHSDDFFCCDFEHDLCLKH
jgi:hypothetical protein